MTGSMRAFPHAGSSKRAAFAPHVSTTTGRAAVEADERQVSRVSSLRLRRCGDSRPLHAHTDRAGHGPSASARPATHRAEPRFARRSHRSPAAKFDPDQRRATFSAHANARAILDAIRTACFAHFARSPNSIRDAGECVTDRPSRPPLPIIGARF
ncbi:hypothetical protein [Burkholderia dolosa]|uniref:hypothetical protein n=1 Tax=Burkholderia dolosa TaxID=152500 RepID=UPI0027D1F86C|nr:hypothetical protein [Burkholderia dolosa]